MMKIKPTYFMIIYIWLTDWFYLSNIMLKPVDPKLHVAYDSHEIFSSYANIHQTGLEQLINPWFWPNLFYVNNV